MPGTSGEYSTPTPESTSVAKADCNRIALKDANLTGASLRFANLSDGDLRNATFRHYNLNDATLHRADLSGANLGDAFLQFADVSDAILDGTDFHGEWVLKTIFGNVDLRQTKHLDAIRHRGPSVIGIDTIYRSQGRVPKPFLRGAGIPDSFLDAIAAITAQPTVYHTVFLSYAGADQVFAEQLYMDLQRAGVRCWFAHEDMKIGDPIRPRIDESIHLSEKLLLVLSRYSATSQWIEQEVETALAKEREHGARSCSRFAWTTR